MRRWRPLGCAVAGLAAAALAGCASTGAGGASGAIADSDIVLRINDAAALTVLRPRPPRSNDCSIFLYSGSSLQFVFFASTRDQAARISVNNRELRLPRVLSDGPPLVPGQPSRQLFREGNVIVDVQLNKGEAIPGGVRVAESLLRMRPANPNTPDGWRTIMPVLGVATCEWGATPDLGRAMQRR